jgi:hypothetical protein
MLEFIGGKVSERKLRLFACSCCRRVEHLLKDDVIFKALDAAERFADGCIRESTVNKWHNKAARARNRQPVSGDWSPEWLACHGVVQALRLGAYDHYSRSYIMVTWAVGKATGQDPGNPSYDSAAQAESAALSDLLRDIDGNPFRPPPTIDDGWLQWGGGTVGRLASGIYDERRFAELPILADALEEAGCDNAEILSHCRSGGEHARGCWLLDLLLNKQ